MKTISLWEDTPRSPRTDETPVRIGDLAVGTLALRFLAGKDPTVDDARKFLDGFGLSRTLDAGAALRAARLYI